MSYKQPRSVQVVVFAESEPGRRYLLLRRIKGHGGFWQSVTGSLEEGETHRQTAMREVREETAIACSADELIDLDLINRFEIAPQWREKYAPGITHNEEVCFALKARLCEVIIDTREHDAYAWVDYDTAVDMLYWESTRRALARTELIEVKSKK